MAGNSPPDPMKDDKEQLSPRSLKKVEQKDNDDMGEGGSVDEPTPPIAALPRYGRDTPSAEKTKFEKIMAPMIPAICKNKDHSQWRLETNDEFQGYILVEKLGEGHFGAKYLVKDKMNKRFALKTEALDADEDSRVLKMEVVVLVALAGTQGQQLEGVPLRLGEARSIGSELKQFAQANKVYE